MNIRMVLVPPEKSKERWNCIFYKTKKAILVGIFSSKLPDSSKESGFVDVKMKFRKSFVVTNGIDKPIILDFHKFGQSSHFGAKRLVIR